MTLPDAFFVRIELTDEGEMYAVHMPTQPFHMLAGAKAWAAQKLAELFRHDHILVRDAVAELVDLIDDLEGEGPFVRSTLYDGQGIKVAIWAAPENSRGLMSVAQSVAQAR